MEGRDTIAGMDELCPRCGSTQFDEHDCGADSYESDITWTAYECRTCGLWYSGWRDEWLIDVASWQDEDGATEFAV